MGFSGKSKTSNESWGMGLLLVFCANDDDATIINNNNNSKSNPFTTATKNTSSNLLSKTQSTISICVLLLFVTLLLFTLSTFNPTSHLTPPRRLLSNWKHNPSPKRTTNSPLVALQGLGTLFKRGTSAMDDLVIAHVTEDVTESELRLFLRTFFMSGLAAKSDLVFIFPHSFPPNFTSIVQQENDSFKKLVLLYKYMNETSQKLITSPSFDVTHFLDLGKKEKVKGETLWGKGIRGSFAQPGGNKVETEFTQLSYGSVVSFEAAELDPENSLYGFLGGVPMTLRRWACYPMLLGRVRRNFKHVMLVDVKDIVLLGDSLARVRTRNHNSVYLFKTGSRHQKQVFSGIIMGGTRGVRRFSNAMLIQMVRVAIQHKGKNSVTESGILNQVVNNGFALQNINLITSTESIPDAGSLATRYSDLASSLSFSDYTAVQRGNSNYDLSSIVMRKICSFAVDSSVYSDCRQ